METDTDRHRQASKCIFPRRPFHMVQREAEVVCPKTRSQSTKTRKKKQNPQVIYPQKYDIPPIMFYLKKRDNRQFLIGSLSSLPSVGDGTVFLGSPGAETLKPRLLSDRKERSHGQAGCEGIGRRLKRYENMRV